MWERRFVPRPIAACFDCHKWDSLLDCHPSCDQNRLIVIGAYSAITEREAASECRFRERRRLLHGVEPTFAMQPAVAWR